MACALLRARYLEQPVVFERGSKKNEVEIPMGTLLACWLPDQHNPCWPCAGSWPALCGEPRLIPHLIRIRFETILPGLALHTHTYLLARTMAHMLALGKNVNSGLRR